VPTTKVVGKPERKVDALRLAKGNAAFAGDIEARGLLHAKVLRSPHAHAQIVAIDDAAATAMPRVHAVLHYGNTPRVKYSSAGQSWPNPYPWDQVSFDDKVRHVGDRVAAVAADTVELAVEACRRIKVTYEVLPAVLDPCAAMADGAPPRTVYVAWPDQPTLAQALVLDRSSYEQARASLVSFWQQQLAQGATLKVPEPRVMNEERNLLIQNLLMG